MNNILLSNESYELLKKSILVLPSIFLIQIVRRRLNNFWNTGLLKIKLSNMIFLVLLYVLFFPNTKLLN